MTRDEYKDLAIKSGISEALFTATGIFFPRILTTIATELFMRSDMTSELSLETRRRINQLNELGWTDD